MTASDVTVLLASLAAGDLSARERLAEITYEELKAIARGQLGSAGDTLQPTVLTHEAYLRLFKGAELRPADRRQFFGLAAKLMRDLVVDHARARLAAKRGGGAQRVTLADQSATQTAPEVDALDLSNALDELFGRDERQHQIVELRYFGGLSMEDIAASLEVSLSTVEREWRVARAWLAVRLAP